MWMQGLGASALACLIPLAAAAGEAGAAPDPTAAQIVEKNVAARGGLTAWRKVETMVWTGHIETGNPMAPIVPFVFELKRPNKSRFEVRQDQEKLLRVFDGRAGWKERAARGAAPTVKPYTPAELASAREAEGIDGVLIDHEAKGIGVALDGTDEVEGRKAYRLVGTLPSGSKRRVWVDAATFLEVKHERETHTPGGRAATVIVFLRNYRDIDGLQLPTTIETRGAEGRAAEKMVIDNITLNPSLSDAHFARPNDLERRHAIPGIQGADPAEATFPHSSARRVAPPTAPAAEGSALSDPGTGSSK
jgi:hypothetical protein